MKRVYATIVLCVSVAVVLSVVTAFTAASTVSAQLGNTSIPATCASVLGAWSSATPTCVAGDGTTFTTVPASHYFLVTDMVVRPSGPATGSWQAYLYKWGPQGQEEWFSIVTQTQTSIGQHFTSPIMVIPSARHIVLENSSTSSGSMTIWVSGVLTNNYNYLPLIQR